MAQQTIDLGAAPNDGLGDDLRTGGDKINDNFTELYASVAGKQPLDADLTTLAAAITAAGHAMAAAADAAAQRSLLRNFGMAKRSAALAAQDWTAGGIISWDAEILDAGGWHDNSTNPSRMTVPSGVSVAELGCTIALTNVTASVQVAVTILKGGSATWDGRPSLSVAVPLTNPRISLSSGPLAVTPGEYFEVQVTVQTDTSVDLVVNSSCFWAKAAV